ncbi:unnamed protein product [Eruca vesicaria subsp. sativa]|uniref:Uncharacterized protein n=1 Tax=Eruca vesicaria subsp. sativa TaxID=29727 RepID=A0ABC8JWR4_ERUVS|nr:unnamed protein product [Eruca vesicaria subsp. sativa]
MMKASGICDFKGVATVTSTDPNTRTQHNGVGSFSELHNLWMLPTPSSFFR